MLHGIVRLAAIGRFARNDSGATSVEYAIMGVMIALVIITSVSLLGVRLSAIFTQTAGAF